MNENNSSKLKANNSYDVVIIGGGPGGYVSAIRAAQLGLKTALVEDKHLGGICLNWGCIPTKALLRSAEVYQLMKNAEEYGIAATGVSFNLEKIVKRSRKVSAQLNKGVSHLLKKNKVTVFDGFAKINGPGKLIIQGKDKKEISAEHIIIATGARAKTLPGLEADGKLIWTYKEAMTPDFLPKSLLVMGAGAIGIEFASFYTSLGVDVTVVEVLDQILPVEDEEIARLAAKSLTKKGLSILTNTMVKELNKGKNSVSVVLECKGKKMELVVDRVISAVGVVGNVEGLGLEKTKIKIDRSFIETNQWSETAERGVYAIGDVSGPPCLAHKASHEGTICVEKIAGMSGLKPLDKSKVPGCTYSLPQVASVGLTEAAAIQQGKKIRIGRVPFQANGKAIALGESEGLIKTIFDDSTGELLGAHMVGTEVTELIQGYVLGQQLETTEHELMDTIFPHPTLSEMMHESVLDAYDRAIHS